MGRTCEKKGEVQTRMFAQCCLLYALYNFTSCLKLQPLHLKSSFNRRVLFKNQRDLDIWEKV